MSSHSVSAARIETGQLLSVWPDIRGLASGRSLVCVHRDALASCFTQSCCHSLSRPSGQAAQREEDACPSLVLTAREALSALATVGLPGCPLPGGNCLSLIIYEKSENHGAMGGSRGIQTPSLVLAWVVRPTCVPEMCSRAQVLAVLLGSMSARTLVSSFAS